MCSLSGGIIVLSSIFARAVKVLNFQMIEIRPDCLLLSLLLKKAKSIILTVFLCLSTPTQGEKRPIDYSCTSIHQSFVGLIAGATRINLQLYINLFFQDEVILLL